MMIPKRSLDLFNSLDCFLDRVPRYVFDNILYYVAMCDMKGFCLDDNAKRLCAEDYLQGERTPGPPGWRKKETLQAERNSLKSSIPEELKEIISEVSKTETALQYRNGNSKALNSCVGMVMKRFKYDAAVVKQLLEKAINESNN
jgi:hypothetical protein